VDEPKSRVLYIAGNGRSGSTILDIVLGQIDGFFAVGEVHRAFDEDVRERSLCGCGAPFRECETWRRIFEDAFGGFDGIDAPRMSRLKMRFAAQKRLLSRRMGRLHPAKWSADLAWYLEHLERFYGSIRRVTGCRVIVDASKWPLYSHMLDRLPSLDPHVVHLVRDPRAVAYSWTRRKEFQPGVLLPRQHPVKTTAYWIVLNPAIRNLWAGRPERYRFLRYRQFATRPREVVEGLLEFVGEPGADLPFLDGNTVRIDPTHAVAGNVVRLRHGGVKLRVDDEWERRMPLASKAIVTSMTLPLLWRYGFETSPTSSRGSTPELTPAE
jgi:hypothetical protein